MVTCPVCEHQQASATECENCGKGLSGAARAKVEVPVQPVEGLEATFAAAVGEVPVERLGELEVNAREATGPVSVERLAEVEPSRFEVAQEVPVERLPDMAEDRVPDDGVRTALPQGPVTCRYCRNVQAEGILCEKCGMRLPKVAAPQPAVVAGAIDPNAQKIWTRCRKCGAPAAVGHRCGDCGHEVPVPDA